MFGWWLCAWLDVLKMPHCVRVLGMCWWSVKNSILVSVVIWLHVKYTPAFLFAWLLAGSLAIILDQPFCVKSWIYHCVCSDLDFISCEIAHSDKLEWCTCSHIRFSLFFPPPLPQDSWRHVISTGVQHGIPMPCFTTALSFYDGYRHEVLPANLIQVGAWNSVVDLLSTEISLCSYLITDLRIMMAVSHGHSPL